MTVSDHEGRSLDLRQFPISNSTCIFMLSNQTSNLHPRQHRRQNSTPTTFDAQKVPLLPASLQQQHQHGSHRRGLSLDQQMHTQHLRQLSPQDDRQRSTNPGLPLTQQHNLREAQPQLLARPGPQLQQPPRIYIENEIFEPSRRPGEDGNQNFSTGPIPNERYIKQEIDFGNANLSEIFANSENHGLSALSSFNSVPSAGYLDGFGLGLNDFAGEVQYDTERKAVTTPSYDGNTHQKPMQHDSSEMQQRPYTPENQSTNVYFPITPATSPFARTSRPTRPPHSRTAHSSPTRRDRSETIKASRGSSMHRGSSCQGLFDEMRHYRSNNGMPSPPHTAPLLSSSWNMVTASGPSFMNTSTLAVNFPAQDNGYESSYHSSASRELSPAMSSFQSSPELPQMSMFHDTDTNMADCSVPLQPSTLPSSQGDMNLGSISSPVTANLMPRSQSFSDLHLDDPIDATIEDTGVTIDEIASFIKGPDLSDGKWTCLFPDCDKKFGRKENIKSHVQTHLGDRQFRCNHCRKCFVRQHDLKRHSKIHSGVKPYPCACGNSFARHDALTRHRQRGMCIGAFDGIMKKPVKRGRPSKKARPDTEERLEKAARTRERALEKAYASSGSGSSECSFPSPPATHTEPRVRGLSPFDNFQDLGPMSYGVSPDAFSYTPSTSPGYSTGNCVSPQQTQHLPTPKALSTSPSPRKRSIRSIPEEVREESVAAQGSPAKTNVSQMGTPPELDLSSSSPAASKFFDFDGSSEPAEGTSQESDPGQSGDNFDGFAMMDMNPSVDQMFFDPFGEANAMTSLERDPTLLLDKFDDAFGPGDHWPEEYTQCADSLFDDA
ncbi:c2h2 transcription factor [Lasallia pustulata]|uniref:C2h2 transcription factor n=1 Tax=Lasallia pustulata TaxID=136370 RepID=A0A1W5D1U5_9LECA|nr:c2h2 transcription factor [Lasallia pustulata]